MIKRRPDSTCPCCGQQFYKPGHPTQKFCSSACAYKNYSANPSPKLKQARPFLKKGIETTCAQCGKQIYRPKHRITEGKRYFCSIVCANKYQARNKKQRKCKVCGKEYYISPSYEKHGNPKFCSIACRDKDIDVYAKLLQMNQYRQAKYPSQLDLYGYQILDEMGCNYQKQYMIDGTICVDAYLPHQKLIIQFDGDYWHGNKEKFPNPDERQQRRMNIDQRQNKYFLDNNYKLLRIWQSEIKQNPEKVKGKIMQYL